MEYPGGKHKNPAPWRRILHDARQNRKDKIQNGLKIRLLCPAFGIWRRVKTGWLPHKVAGKHIADI